MDLNLLANFGKPIPTSPLTNSSGNLQFVIAIGVSPGSMSTGERASGRMPESFFEHPARRRMNRTNFNLFTV